MEEASPAPLRTLKEGYSVRAQGEQQTRAGACPVTRTSGQEPAGVGGWGPRVAQEGSSGEAPCPSLASVSPP